MIRFSLKPRRGRDFTTRPLEPEDGEALAALHGEGSARPWGEEEFANLLSQDTVFGFAAIATGQPRAAPAGFVLARHAAGEAEILTVIVARVWRRRGIGRQLMDAVLRELHALRADALFLEVDETNLAAIGLYRKLGFMEVGKRPDYYAHGNRRTGALVMRRDLK